MPLIVNEVPGALHPGARVPPLFTCVLPIVPVPPSVPPFTVKGELASEPFTSKMPCCTVHGRVPALKPVKVQVAAPILLNVSKPWYCAAGPIRLTSNDPMPEPPSCKRLLAPDAITSPLMIEVGPKVSVLPPLPAKKIAKVVPVILPLLVTSPAAKVLMPTPPPPAVPVPEIVPLLVTVAVMAWMPKPPPTTGPVPEIVPLLVTVAVLARDAEAAVDAAGARDGAVIGHGRGDGFDPDADGAAGARNGALLVTVAVVARMPKPPPVPVLEMVPLLVTVAVMAWMPKPRPPTPLVPEMVPLLVTVAVVASIPKPPLTPGPVPEMVPLLVTVAVVAKMPKPPGVPQYRDDADIGIGNRKPWSRAIIG